LLDSCDIANYEACEQSCPGCCGPSIDCDGDGILNSCEIADGAADCNGNGIPDSCDIANYVLEDCNENGIGDACEKQISIGLGSARMSPLGYGQPKEWVFGAVIPAVDGPLVWSPYPYVLFTLYAHGDLSSAQEYVTTTFGSFSRRSFVGWGADCEVVLDEFFVPIDIFNAAIAPDGTLRITLTPSAAVDANFCGGDTWIEAFISYVGATSADCNANGVIDTCEIDDGFLADANNNRVPDACEDPIQLCPADFDGNDAVDGADLGLLLGAWGGASLAFDLDDSGAVDGADLGLLLGAWGGCIE
jgi:hypothetical protein